MAARGLAVAQALDEAHEAQDVRHALPVELDDPMLGHELVLVRRRPKEVVRDVDAAGGGLDERRAQAARGGVPIILVRGERGEEVVVGVNRFQPDVKDEVEILDIDNTAVRQAQVARLKQVRATRDEDACRAALEALSAGADDASANLLELSVNAARARATVGEISDALEGKFTRHRAVIRSITGVYGSAFDGDEAYSKIATEINRFAEDEGRRPRMLVVKLGQDGHDRGQKVIASAFADRLSVGHLFVFLFASQRRGTMCESSSASDMRLGPVWSML